MYYLTHLTLPYLTLPYLFSLHNLFLFVFLFLFLFPTTPQVEGDEGGYDEEFPLEGLEILTSDFMAKVAVGDFRRSWEEVRTFEQPLPSLIPSRSLILPLC